MQTNTTSEQHPFFPSGEWEGFYNYGSRNDKGNMATILNFSNGVISGSGSDPVGSFEWKGQYDTKSETCYMVKKYTGMHSVYYKGQADENGIWGTWIIHANLTGGFHIWPKKKSNEDEQTMEYDEQAVSKTTSPNALLF